MVVAVDDVVAAVVVVVVAAVVSAKASSCLADSGSNEVGVRLQPTDSSETKSPLLSSLLDRREEEWLRSSLDFLSKKLAIDRR